MKLKTSPMYKFLVLHFLSMNVPYIKMALIKMKSIKALPMKLLALSIITLLLASCGVGDSVGRIKGTGGGNFIVAKSISSTGTLNSASTLSVNGITYDSTVAEVIIDNHPGVIGDLQVGQVVAIDASVALGDSQAVAESIRFDTSILGPIDEVSDNSMVILGQDIIVYDDTYFAGDNLQSVDGLAEKDVLKLSGYPLSDGRFVATYIERLTDTNTSFIVTGNVANLDELVMQFSINELLIDYSELAALPVLINGQSVKVSGEVVDNNGRQQFNVSAIDIRNSQAIAAETLSETQGFITRFFSSAEFEIDGRMISTSRSTEYIGGQESDLEQDVMVEVEGVVDAAGIVNATRVIFLVATLDNLSNSQRLYEESQDFIWSTVSGAQAYKIIVKNSLYHTLYEQVFAAEDIDSMGIATLKNIPSNGSAIIVYLQTQYYDGTWFTKRYDFSTAETIQQTELLSHREGDTLTGTTETFVWQDVNAKAYSLTLSSGEWEASYDFSGSVTDVTISDIPDNSATITVELTVTNDNDYTYTKYYTLIGMKGLPYATLSSHRDKTILDASDVTFSWYEVGADAYEVTIGNAGFYTRQTYPKGTHSAHITGLPVNGTTIYFTLKTIRDGAAHIEHYRLVTAELQATAELTSHRIQDEVLSSTSTDFEWNDVGAEKYVLRITSGFFYDHVLHHQEYRGDTTSVTIDNLPNNCSTLRVHLWTYHESHYRKYAQNLISPCEQDNAVLLSHQEDETLSSTSTQLTWSDVGADEYHLSVASEASFRSEVQATIYSQYLSGDTTSVNIDDLPENGVPVKVLLRTRHGQGWHLKKYTLTSATNNVLQNAQLISHKGLDEFDDTTVTFEWSDVGADEYHVTIISDDDSIVLDKSFRDDTTSVVVENITDDVRVNINTRHGNGWHTETYILYAHSDKQTAVLTDYKDNDKLNSTTATFKWTDVGAAEYYVRVTSGFGSNILLEETYSGDVLSVTLDNLPDNCANIEFNLYTRYSLYGRRSKYSFVSPCNEQKQNAVLLEPLNGDILHSTTTLFRWNNTGADEYHLRIRSSARGTAAYNIFGEDGDQDYYFSGDTSSVEISGLPDNDAFLWVQLRTRYGNGWHIESSIMTSVGGRSNAELTSHVDGEFLISDTVMFEWTDVGADEYRLFIQDADDSTVIFDGRYNSGTIAAEVNNLPANINVFLNTRYGNAWHSRPYVFTR